MSAQQLSQFSNVEVFSLSQALRRFRQQLESQAEKPIHEIDANAALLLSDLCVFMGLGERQHDTILGQEAVNFLTEMLDTKVKMITKH